MRPFKHFLILPVTLCFTLVHGACAREPLAAETLTQETLTVPYPAHTVFIYDEAFNNEIDSRVVVFDADHQRRLGQIDSGYYPNVAVSPDHLEFAVATTYWSRGGHGTRSDVVEFWDLKTLRIKNEIVLPNTRLQGPPTLYHLAYSKDGKFLYSHALTPASSWTVVDLTSRKVVTDIDTDGCVQVIPSLNRRMTGICESGRLLSVTLDDSGHEQSRVQSDVFFDDSKDPVFIQAIPTDVGVAFLSHHGQVHEVDLSSQDVRIKKSWSIIGAQDQQWRPGGTQMGAWHAGLHRFFVQMHIGKDGSHKDGGSEVWVFDTVSHNRVARFVIDTKRYGEVLATQVTSDRKPLLILATSQAKVLTLDAGSGQILHVKTELGQTPWYVVNP